MQDDIGTRLREERTRLGLKQLEVAQLIDRKATNGMRVSRWERGERTPDAQALAILDCAGFDIRYLITGTRTRALTD